MTKDLDGIPFSTTDEGVDYLARVAELVVEASGKCGPEDVYVVWFCKTLQNWKALASITVPDGHYYELTHDGDKNKTYVDTYVKTSNVSVAD